MKRRIKKGLTLYEDIDVFGVSLILKIIEDNSHKIKSYSSYKCHYIHGLQSIDFLINQVLEKLVLAGI